MDLLPVDPLHFVIDDGHTSAQRPVNLRQGQVLRIQDPVPDLDGGVQTQTHEALNGGAVRRGDGRARGMPACRTASEQKLDIPQSSLSPTSSDIRTFIGHSANIFLIHSTLYLFGEKFRF